MDTRNFKNVAVPLRDIVTHGLVDSITEAAYLHQFAKYVVGHER